MLDADVRKGEGEVSHKRARGRKTGICADIFYERPLTQEVSTEDFSSTCQTTCVLELVSTISDIRMQAHKVDVSQSLKSHRL